MLRGKDAMLQLQYLPLMRPLARAHYEGSIDKLGGNSDWDWSLYRDENGEWVIFDVMGPGCVYNIVQHRYISSPEVTFRFYFDGEEKPRFQIKSSQFGELAPFLEPLAGRYVGPVQPELPYTPIRVVRSYVPMPFADRLKITTDVRLEGNGAGAGGWGHVVYHTYADEAAAGLASFRPDDSLYELSQLWKRTGHRLLDAGMEAEVTPPFDLAPQEERAIYRDGAAGLVCGIQMQLRHFDRAALGDLWLRARWDGHEAADVYLPFGCLFGNELGFHGVSYLLNGMGADGSFYCRFPMPYESRAELCVINRGEASVRIDFCRVERTRAYNQLYAENEFGYFRAAYYPRRHTEGADSVIAKIEGSGHVVGAIITGFGAKENGRADCEGDVRVYLDGLRTPQIESDGSESYASYGWGFATPAECHPMGGYDGEAYMAHKNWSLTRLCVGDCYPFCDSVRFGIESGWNNDWYMEHSGAVFYYGRDEKRLQRLSSIVTGNRELEAFFEGDDDDVPWRLRGDYGQTTRFTAALPARARALLLRRVSDQGRPRQMADVLVNGARCRRAWYFADANPHKRWLEDEYIVPAGYLRKGQVNAIEIAPSRTPWANPWNAFGLEAFAIM